jgi:AhpD family alkylhydroperoxidase
MQPRIASPATSVPGVVEAMQVAGKAVNDAAEAAGVPTSTIELIGLRASQIIGCAACLHLHARGARKAGDTDERLLTLSAWREAPDFTETERAALAPTEVGCRLADRGAPIPHEVFEKLSECYDEPTFAALGVDITAINAWNRRNVVSGGWTPQGGLKTEAQRPKDGRP